MQKLIWLKNAPMDGQILDSGATSTLLRRLTGSQQREPAKVLVAIWHLCTINWKMISCWLCFLLLPYNIGLVLMMVNKKDSGRGVMELRMTIPTGALENQTMLVSRTARRSSLTVAGTTCPALKKIIHWIYSIE